MTAAGVSADTVGPIIANGNGMATEPVTLPLHWPVNASLPHHAGGTGVVIDPRFVLPRCEMPLRKDYEPVESFVATAVQEQHQQKDDSIPVASYKGILDAIRFKNDPVMLQRLLLALRTAGNGSTLHLLTTTTNKHARMMHSLVRLNVFELPKSVGEKPGEGTERKVDYAVADAHLHLLMALVSANSVFLVPAITALWKMLTFRVTDAPPERYG